MAIIPKSSLLNDINVSTGNNIARLVFLMRNWQEDSLTLRGSTDNQTKDNINAWLNEFERLFTGEITKLSTLYAYNGFAEVVLSAESQGEQINIDLSKENFLILYTQRIEQMRGKVQTQARLLRNGLAQAWGKDWKQFYDRYDEFIVEANALGLTLKEQTEKFLANPLQNKMIKLRDSAGRYWQPNHYSAMFARTRGREVEDIVRVDQSREMGVNIVQVSNANTVTPICLKYEGKYYYIDTPVEGLERLPIRPPFHPNCVHRIYPIVRDNLTKYQKTNRNKTRKFNNESGSFTDAQKRAIVKQERWNLANRIQV